MSMVSATAVAAKQPQSMKQVSSAAGPVKTHRGPIPPGSEVFVQDGRTIVLPPRVGLSPPRPGSEQWIKDDRSYRTASAMSSARVALQKGDLKWALRSAKAAVAVSHGYDAGALLLRGQIRELAGEEMDALEDYSASLALDPQLRAAREARAKLFTTMAAKDLKTLAGSRE